MRSARGSATRAWLRLVTTKLVKQLLKVVAAVVMVGTIGYLALPYLVCLDVPKYAKLADCNTNALAFKMTCDHSPSAFVLGLGPSPAGPLTFRGEILVQQGTGTVARIPIDSDHITPCNWLAGAGLDGYLLAWDRTNDDGRLSKRLRRGQGYEVRVTFLEAPPTNSSLWLSSIGRAKLW